MPQYFDIFSNLLDFFKKPFSIFHLHESISVSNNIRVFLSGLGVSTPYNIVE